MSLQHEITVSTERPSEEAPSIDDDSSDFLQQDAGYVVRSMISDIALEECGLVSASHLLQQAGDSPNVSANSPRQATRSLTSELGAIDVANDNAPTEVAVQTLTS
ncbi:hypothetical protein V7S43_004475 [Phytophthora oleae]|uniref:Uncharacterized protein n=1 Tax=Phytophthora oleae TaxID=2107226 RepID=A0ABD3FWV2_9STRA